MSPALQLLRRNAKRICAVLVLLALYQLAQLPSVSSSERAALATRFRFVATPQSRLGRPSRPCDRLTRTWRILFPGSPP
jgi:hypothetical protein